jgi:hypothetical protein
VPFVQLAGKTQSGPRSSLQAVPSAAAGTHMSVASVHTPEAAQNSKLPSASERQVEGEETTRAHFPAELQPSPA